MLDNAIKSARDLAYSRLISSFSDPGKVEEIKQGFILNKWDPQEVDPRLIAMLRGLDGVIEVIDKDLPIVEILEHQAGILPLLLVLTEYAEDTIDYLDNQTPHNLPFEVDVPTYEVILNHIINLSTILDEIHNNRTIQEDTLHSLG